MSTISFKVREVEYKATRKHKENHAEIMISKGAIVYAVIKLFPDREPKAFADNVDIDVLQAALELDMSYKFEYKNKIYDAHLDPMIFGGISLKISHNYEDCFVAFVNENDSVDESEIMLDDMSDRFIEFYMSNFYLLHKKQAIAEVKEQHKRHGIKGIL